MQTNTVLLDERGISSSYFVVHFSSMKSCSRGFIAKWFYPSDMQFINKFVKRGECLDLLWVTVHLQISTLVINNLLISQPALSHC